MSFLTRIKETGWFYDGNRSTSKTNKYINLNPKIGFHGHLKKSYPCNLTYNLCVEIGDRYLN